MYNDILPVIIDNCKNRVITDKQLFNLLDDYSFDYSDFQELMDKLDEEGIIINNSTLDGVFQNDDTVICSSLENQRSLKSWIELKNITFKDIDAILKESKNKNIKCEVAYAFILHLIKTFFLDEIKNEFKNIPNYASERLGFSRAYVFKQIRVVDRFIRLKDFNMDVKLFNIMNPLSYNVFGDGFNNPFQVYQLQELLYLSDEDLEDLIVNKIINSKMTAREIRTVLHDMNLKNSDKTNVVQEVVLHLPVLKIGSTGNVVKRLQQILLAEHLEGSTLCVDGNFDSNTERMLKIYQKCHNLCESGICDSETWKSLML